MLGHRRADLGLANKFYSSPVKVEFILVKEDYIGQLIQALKDLKYEVKNYYEHDQLLLEETETFIQACRRVVGTINKYSTYFRENNELIVKYFTLTKRRIYADLFKNNIEPIVDLIKTLRKKQNNAYVETLLKLVTEKHLSSVNTYILTKEKPSDELIEVNGLKYKLMTDKEFIDLGIFADAVIFLGTPGYFDSKFSTVFYGKQTIFMGYSCFAIRLGKKKSFSNLINSNHLINTIYKDVNIDKGFSGLDFKETFVKGRIKKSEEYLINQFESITHTSLGEKVEVKLATISNDNYIFLPIRQKVNVIDRDSLKISQEAIKDLSAGDLLIFRDHNASSLIREEADNIMGVNAERHRESLEKWKRRLRHNVKRKGIDRVSKILRRSYKISVATENNIKNWMSNDSIRPSCLDELLQALKFDQEVINEILSAASEIRSAHISAGHHISRSLMNELDRDLENVVNENGFYMIESKEFKGACFNIEEIKNISNEIYFIPENEILKIIKG
ncbi:DISARM anti-phage system protein DrmE domain-containing protein [Bacillus atrophaeus]|uniref:DISARM anti-phage system protein DrmE domain-containing protein n=1 Tax=Bacillus atrophaeus TaxID=1452 RepID=UPI003ED91B25